MDIDETFTQVRPQYQNLQLEGWDKLTAESSTIHNNGKTGRLGLFGGSLLSALMQHLPVLIEKRRFPPVPDAFTCTVQAVEASFTVSC